MNKLKYAISLLFFGGALLFAVSLITSVFGILDPTTSLIMVAVGFGMATIAMLAALIMVSIQQSRDRHKPLNAKQQAWNDIILAAFIHFPWI